MSFVAGFYSFNIAINNSDTGCFIETRIKLPHHQLEPLTHLYARVIAFAHCYAEGLAFTNQYAGKDTPDLWKRDVTGTVECAVAVGAVDAHKVHRWVKQRTKVIKIYFYASEQVEQFCRGLKGSRDDWIAEIEFLKLEPELPEQLAAAAKSSDDWSFNFTDGVLYLSTSGAEYQSQITAVDMWSEYQQFLKREREKSAEIEDAERHSR